MAKFRKKPVVIEAEQFLPGDGVKDGVLFLLVFVLSGCADAIYYEVTGRPFFQSRHAGYVYWWCGLILMVVGIASGCLAFLGLRIGNGRFLILGLLFFAVCIAAAIYFAHMGVNLIDPL